MLRNFRRIEDSYQIHNLRGNLESLFSFVRRLAQFDAKGAHRSSILTMASFPSLRLLSILGLILLATTTDAHSYSGADYYKDSCPQATAIVTDMVNNFVKANKNLAGGFLRLHFHDCFVRVSLHNSTPPNSTISGADFQEVNEVFE